MHRLSQPRGRSHNQISMALQSETGLADLVRLCNIVIT